MRGERKFTAITVFAVALGLLVLAVGYGLASGRGVVSGAYTAVLAEKTVMQVALTVDEAEWENLLENATDEEFIPAEVTVDGVSYGLVGLRAKGNSSLSQVAASDSDRYSFKLDFEKYVEGNSFEGLNDLALNNMISDPSYLKEYLSYKLFERMGVETPLCRFAWITVNGEDWGLYLAVEQIKEDFLERNYGADYGNLYKPDTMEIGGNKTAPDFGGGELPEGFGNPGGAPGEMAEQGPGEGWNHREAGGAASAVQQEQAPEGRPDLPNGQAAEQKSPGEASEGLPGTAEQERGKGSGPEDGGAAPDGVTEPPEWAKDETALPEGAPADREGGFQGRGGFSPTGGGGTNLVYTDDELSSYSGIFDNTETGRTTETDKKRLVSLLKQLSEGEDPASIMEVEEVLRYFVVNTFLVNLDSYASGMKHNYYLYEKDGKLSILPWDFNLSFGAYQAGDAEKVVNFPIDTPVTDSMENSPLIAKLLEVPEYLERYHELYQLLLSQVVENGWYEAEIAEMAAEIAPYVERDPTAFYTVEEFEAAVEQLGLYFTERAGSIRAQLVGEQPADSYGDLETALDMSALGGMNMGAGGEKRQAGAVSAMGRMMKPGGGPFGRVEEKSAVSEQLLLTGGCVLLFFGGILFLLRFRRRKYRSK